MQARRGLRRAARESYREALRRNPGCAPARDALALLSAGLAWRRAWIILAVAGALLLLSAGLAVREMQDARTPPAVDTKN